MNLGEHHRVWVLGSAVGIEMLYGSYLSDAAYAGIEGDEALHMCAKQVLGYSAPNKSTYSLNANFLTHPLPDATHFTCFEPEKGINAQMLVDRISSRARNNPVTVIAYSPYKDDGHRAVDVRKALFKSSELSLKVHFPEWGIFCFQNSN